MGPNSDDVRDADLPRPAGAVRRPDRGAIDRRSDHVRSRRADGAHRGRGPRWGDLAAATRHDASSSVPVTGLCSGNGLYDAELLRRIEARRYPVAKLELRRLHAWSEAPAGTASPAVSTSTASCRSLEGTVSVDPRPDGSIIVTGDHAFDIRDFDIASPTVLMLRIYPDVTVKLQVEAVPIDDARREARDRHWSIGYVDRVRGCSTATTATSTKRCGRWVGPRSCRDVLHTVRVAREPDPSRRWPTCSSAPIGRPARRRLRRRAVTDLQARRGR